MRVHSRARRASQVPSVEDEGVKEDVKQDQDDKRVVNGSELEVVNLDQAGRSVGVQAVLYGPHGGGPHGEFQIHADDRIQSMDPMKTHFFEYQP